MEIQNIPWNAVSAKLRNEAEANDILQIQEWLDSSPENPMILTEIVNIWSITKGQPESYQPDLTYNWDKLIFSRACPILTYCVALSRRSEVGKVGGGWVKLRPLLRLRRSRG